MPLHGVRPIMVSAERSPLQLSALASAILDSRPSDARDARILEKEQDSVICKVSIGLRRLRSG